MNNFLGPIFHLISFITRDMFLRQWSLPMFITRNIRQNTFLWRKIKDCLLQKNVNFSSRYVSYLKVYNYLKYLKLYDCVQIICIGLEYSKPDNYAQIIHIK